jgi:type I restriction enzyme, S subunit
MKWDRFKLDEICEVVGGTTPSTTNSDYWEGDNIWLSPVDLPAVGTITEITQSKKMITAKAIKDCSLRVLPVGSLVFSTRASIGKIGIVKKPLVTNQGFTNLIPSKRVNVKYLAYALKHYIPKIETLGNSTTFNEVSRTSFKNFKIPLPPIHLQEQIAETLDKVDALHIKDQELLTKYDQLALAIFYDMFGDPVSNEKGWDMSDLSRIAFIKPESIISVKTIGLKFVGLENIEKETGNISFSLNTEIKSNKFKFNEDSILYGKLRPYLKKVALPSFSGVCSTDIYPINCIESNKYFLASILKSKHFTDYATSSSVGANLPRINKESILSYRTIIPPRKLQQLYGDKIMTLIQSKEIVSKVLKNSDKLFARTMKEYFS